MSRDRFSESNVLHIRLKLIGRRPGDNLQYAKPTASEIAWLFVGNFGVHDKNRDILVEHRDEKLKRRSILHPSLMSMQYPILFPYGEDGYIVDMEYVSDGSTKSTKRSYITMQ